MKGDHNLVSSFAGIMIETFNNVTFDQVDFRMFYRRNEPTQVALMILPTAGCTLAIPDGRKKIFKFTNALITMDTAE